MQQQRQERIQLETTRHRITGDLTLSETGFRSRISDLLNATEREFLPLTGATVEPLDGGAPTEHAFLAVSRAHIVYVVPLDGGSEPSA